MFTVLNSGALEIQLDSTTALSVMDAGGNSIFSVDTTNDRVRIGSATADGTGVLFVLDEKNTAGDPAGINGSLYYNSSLGKLRCFEGGTWSNCVGSASVRSFIDSTSDTVVDADTTDYWDTAAENNNSHPNITPSASSGVAIMGVVTMELTSTTNQDVEVTGRVERGIGSVPTCGSGTSVGGQPGVFTTNNGAVKSSTVTFTDTPNTTSTVYYVFCSDAATSGTNANVTRIRVTLQEVSNSN